MNIDLYCNDQIQSFWKSLLALKYDDNYLHM